jgi:hypothetical protein
MPRTRRATSVLAALLAGLSVSTGVAACGGEKIAADEVSAPPPELTIPSEGNEKGADTLSSGDAGSGDDTGTTSTTPDDRSPGDDAPSSSGGGSSGSNGSAGSSGSTGSSGSSGTPAPQATAAPSNPGGGEAPAQAPQPDSSRNDVAPTPGSGADKFEEFCQQNAGAC